MKLAGHDSVSAIVDRFTKRGILIACSKTPNTNPLTYLLWSGVFSWTDVPQRIVGEHDTRLSTSALRALTINVGKRDDRIEFRCVECRRPAETQDSFKFGGRMKPSEGVKIQATSRQTRCLVKPVELR
jgi:hypothetical protein